TSATEVDMGRVKITFMARPTLRAHPHSYPQGAQSTRASASTAHRASHTGVAFGNFAVVHAQPFGLIFQACAKLAPSSIIDGFGHTSLSKFVTRDIAHSDQPSALHNCCGGFVCPIFAAIGNLGMDGFDAALLVGTLRQSQSVFMHLSQILSGVRFIHVCTPELIGEPQVNANLDIPSRYARVFNFALEIDVPATTGILCEAPSLRHTMNRTREPKAEAALQIFDAVALDLEKARLEGYPSQRPLPRTPLQAALVTGFSLGDILSAYLGYSVGMQA